MFDTIKDWSEKLGWSQSQIIERCVIFGMPQLKNSYVERTEEAQKIEFSDVDKIKTSCVIDVSVVDQLDEWSEQLGWDRNKILECCVGSGMRRFKQEFIDVLEVAKKEEIEDKRDKGQRLADAAFRKWLFEPLRDGKWK